MEISNRISETLEQYIGPTKTIDTLRKCFENAIFTKIKYRYDIIDFLRFVKGLRKETAPIVSKINKIITEAPSNYEEQIDQVYYEELGDDYNKIRLLYTIKVLLPYVKKLIAVHDHLENDLENYINTFEEVDPDSTIASLNEIFLKNTGRNYNYFQNRYSTVVTNQYVTQLFNRWKAPKFVIVPERGPRQVPGRGPGQRPSTVIEKTNEKSSKALRVMQRNINTGIDRTLVKDFEKINTILASYNQNLNVRNAQSLWETKMFTYIQDKNLHPRELVRNSLLAITCWIYILSFEDISLENLRSLCNQIGYETEDVPYAMGLYNKMFLSEQNSQYKQNFMNKLGTYTIHIDKIKEYMESQSLDKRTISNIVDILQTFLPKNKKDLEDHIYRTLKQITKKITRKTVQTFFN